VLDLVIDGLQFGVNYPPHYRIPGSVRGTKCLATGTSPLAGNDHSIRNSGSGQVKIQPRNVLTKDRIWVTFSICRSADCTDMSPCKKKTSVTFDAGWGFTGKNIMQMNQR
jgi:hypothetical protein